MTSVEQLYQLCEVIDTSKEKPEEETSLQNAYLSIINATKGGVNEKRLAAQFIVRYFGKFPAQRVKALEALFSLCEDVDINIRKYVIKELPTLCKTPGTHHDKIVDVLVQLLQATDAHENNSVQQSLSSLLETHTKICLQALFEHILHAEEDLLRERASKYLVLKLRTLSSTVFTKELQDFVILETKKVLQDVTGDEFILFMTLLSHLPQLMTVTGRQQLLDIVTEQADLEKSFDPNDLDRVDQIIQCVKQAIPFMSRNVPSTRYAQYMLVQVLPALQRVKAPTDEASEALQLELLRLSAEVTSYAGDFDGAEAVMTTVYQLFLECVPTPPSEAGDAINGEVNGVEEAKVQFSQLECLCWILHQLGKKTPTFFTEEARMEETKEFRKRLSYLARLSQVYSKKLREVLAAKPKEELKLDENKMKVIALRTTSNIQALVKDFLHTPPQYKSVISPSWKPPGSGAAPVADAPPKRAHAAPPPTAMTADAAAKRAARFGVPTASADAVAKRAERFSAAAADAPAATEETVGGRKRITGPAGAPAAKVQRVAPAGGRQIYQPPSGKYSEKIGSVPAETMNGRGGSVRGRGGRGRRGNPYKWVRN